MKAPVPARLDSAMRLVSPGAPLWEAIGRIRSAGTGALVLIGDAQSISSVCDGGFRLDAELTPQRIAELAKMDGAIVLDAEARTILGANVHLVPPGESPTRETGVRHRTADRISSQTGAIVLTVSRKGGTVALWVDGVRTQLP